MSPNRKRGEALDELNEQKNVTPLEPDDGGFWADLCSCLSTGQLIPIISGSLFYDLIFNPDKKACASSHQEKGPDPVDTIETMLARYWAEKHCYRFPDQRELPRVAQHVRSMEVVSLPSKNEYLRVIKQRLIEFALEKASVNKPGANAASSAVNSSSAARNTSSATFERDIKKINGESRGLSFTDLAVGQLDLLKFGPGCDDPLSVLARLPLPIYITTSYHEFLELALISMGKKPITQVCFWGGDTPLLKPEHEPIKRLDPSPRRPLVYHLFGLDRYPSSLVLTEDDYLDFLTRVIQMHKTNRPVIPVYLRAALSASSLLLLGYQLQDWDFRTLFRGLITTQESHTRVNLNTIIQLSMESQYNHPASDDVHKFFDQVEGYLQGYFNNMSFEIHWDDPACFLNVLNKQWKARSV